ncbi:CofC family guanylyltransferase [Sphingomonas immobilis]|uniref:NTP transferase domain-containing protein n=1 Tax=Sphingomonas immobilis TaxID=3063997 RepID=A0ABT9A008_9SPHN|nr:NTP transferase domain-containing protein [Sphingomonas sp. CA1-15]MDO7843158.1 NTP transferase domain-containing protein [Sphingomonas sp. CA1-15]
MEWHAIVSIKRGPAVKSRLASALSPDARVALAEAMAAHVLATLRRAARIASVSVFSASPWPDGSVGWEADHGEGLNRGLQRIRDAAPNTNQVFLHADLPLLTPDDVDAFCAGTEEHGGLGLAPDRYGKGTNGVALVAFAPFTFDFGTDSLQRHVEAASGTPFLIHSPGLSHDLDTVEELRMLPDTWTGLGGARTHFASGKNGAARG